MLFVLFATYGCGTNSDQTAQTITTPATIINDSTRKVIPDSIPQKVYLSEIDKSIKFKVIKITTDKTFQNFISFDLENTSNKQITNIEIQEGKNINNLEINLSPGKKKVFKIETEFEMIPNNLGIQKIRFEDGTFETRTSTFKKLLDMQKQ